MQRSARLTLSWLAAGLCAIVAALGIAWVTLVPGDEEVARLLAAQAEAKLGVKATVRSARLHLWPSPHFVVEDAQTVQPAPIRIQRMVAQVSLLPLLRGRLQLEDVDVDGAVLPQLSLRALRVRPAGPDDATGTVRLARLHFRDAVWITRYGVPLEFSGSALFGADGSLREAQLVRSAVQPAAQLTLAAIDADRWTVDLQVGGGTANGEVAIMTAADGAMTLTGTLTPRRIDLPAALSAFKRRSTMGGKGSGQTTLSARGKGIGELARSLHTSTVFTVSAPRLLHIDVDKAIRTLGQERDGQTALQSLGGTMQTQNTADGMVVRYTGLQAKGQSFSASGGGTIAKRQVNGELKLDVAGGVVGVPLKVSGPIGQPRVNLDMAGGAAAVTAVTATGAAIGSAIGAAVGKVLGAAQSR